MLRREFHARRLVARLTKELSEYRTRLVADVITGKLDVREAAAVLPELDPFRAEDGLDDRFDTEAESRLEEINATPKEIEA